MFHLGRHVRLLASQKPLRRSGATAVASTSILLGALLLVVVLASGVFGAAEVENGTLTGAATIVSVSSASGGKAVMFSGGAPSPTPTPAPIPTPTPTPSSGFPDATTTGYQNAPGYPGTHGVADSTKLQSCPASFQS